MTGDYTQIIPKLKAGPVHVSTETFRHKVIACSGNQVGECELSCSAQALASAVHDLVYLKEESPFRFLLLVLAAMISS